MILVHLHEPVTIDELKKTVKNIKHMVPEQMIKDATGNIHKKCKAYKQAEGGHFETFLWYLKKQFWIIFKVLVSSFFYELYFLSYALIVGVSREKSYCTMSPAFRETRQEVKCAFLFQF